MSRKEKQGRNYENVNKGCFLTAGEYKIEFRRKFKPADTGKLGLGVGTSAERTGGNGKRTKNAERNRR